MRRVMLQKRMRVKVGSDVCRDILDSLSTVVGSLARTPTWVSLRDWCDSSTAELPSTLSSFVFLVCSSFITP
jgi:hypothetical protein